ncbi:hypothetical protein ABZ690_28045 [Streptomyces sp. NPDC006967]|uniref:hypothetical protein n=1 Tax=unclassified Streptomyces TaxID=2593676 RepID=UPI0033E45E0C
MALSISFVLLLGIVVVVLIRSKSVKPGPAIVYRGRLGSSRERCSARARTRRHVASSSRCGPSWNGSSRNAPSRRTRLPSNGALLGNRP